MSNPESGGILLVTIQTKTDTGTAFGHFDGVFIAKAGTSDRVLLRMARDVLGAERYKGDGHAPYTFTPFRTFGEARRKVLGRREYLAAMLCRDYSKTVMVTIRPAPTGDELAAEVAARWNQ